MKGDDRDGIASDKICRFMGNATSDTIPCPGRLDRYVGAVQLPSKERGFQLRLGKKESRMELRAGGLKANGLIIS